jgi:hypothetical protein
MKRYEIEVQGALDDGVVAELDAIATGISPASPTTAGAATTLLHAEVESSDDLTDVLKALEDLGLGLSRLRVLDDH